MNGFFSSERKKVLDTGHQRRWLPWTCWWPAGGSRTSRSSPVAAMAPSATSLLPMATALLVGASTIGTTSCRFGWNIQTADFDADGG